MSNLALGPDEKIQGHEVNQSLLSDVAKKMVKEFTVIPESLLGETVPGDCDELVLCHFASLVLLFVDAWKEGDGEHVLEDLDTPHSRHISLIS